MRASVATVLVLLAMVAPWAVLAQYPEKPVTILVGFGAGSGGDLIARGLAEAAKKHLRQPIVVVNRPGAAGTVAISEAIVAKPDGYTLGLGTVGTLTLQPHQTPLSYGGPETYVPVAKLVTQPHVLMVRAGAPWRTVQEFLDTARASRAAERWGAGHQNRRPPQCPAAQAPRECRPQGRVLRRSETGGGGAGGAD